jgi:hypothetical protein
VPPLNVGAIQLIPRVVGDFNEVSSIKLVGASGFVKILAPLPF